MGASNTGAGTGVGTGGTTGTGAGTGVGTGTTGTGAGTGVGTGTTGLPSARYIINVYYWEKYLLQENCFCCYFYYAADPVLS